jgi:hypothetical protein
MIPSIALPVLIVGYPTIMLGVITPVPAQQELMILAI